MGKPVTTVNLEQHYNPKQSPKDPEPYIYYVASLRNRVEPVVGSTIRQSEVKKLIESGTTVNITQPK